MISSQFLLINYPKKEYPGLVPQSVKGYKFNPGLLSIKKALIECFFD